MHDLTPAFIYFRNRGWSAYQYIIQCNARLPITRSRLVSAHDTFRDHPSVTYVNSNLKIFFFFSRLLYLKYSTSLVRQS